jgi:hypothetical protein
VRSTRAFLVSGGIPGAVESVVLKPVESSQMPPGPLKVLHWFNRYLDDSEKAQMREWLRVKVGAGGRSLRDVVEDHPSWGTWSTFNRRRDRICWRVAWEVDARGVPWFDLDADGHVIGL